MKRFLSLFLTAVFLIAAAVPAFAEKALDPAKKATEIIQYYRQETKTPESSEETLIFAATHLLTDSIPPYFTPIEDGTPAADVAKRICQSIAAKQDPTNDNGQNYTALLAEKQQENGSFENTLHDTVYAVIALQAADAEYNRDQAIAYILSRQKEDGGFSYTEDSANEIEATATTLTVLSTVRNENKTYYDAAADALAFLKNRQNEDGGFSSSGVSNCVETAWAILAAADMERISDENWTKALKTLSEFQAPDGGYGLVKDLGQSDRQSTALALMAFESARYGASVYKTLATNKTIAPSFSFENFKPILYVFCVLAGLSVIFWIFIFVRKPKTRTLEESKHQTEAAIEAAERYIRKEQGKNKNETQN